jgi:hypothetical protein
MPGDFLADDIATMVITEEFGFEVVWTPQGGAAQPAFNAIFNEGVTQIDPVTGQVDNENPYLEVAKANVSGIKQGDNIAVVSRNFNVLKKPIKNDSDDLIVIVLSEVTT